MNDFHPDGDWHDDTCSQDRLPLIVACIASALFVVAVGCGLAAVGGWFG